MSGFKKGDRVILLHHGKWKAPYSKWASEKRVGVVTNKLENLPRYYGQIYEVDFRKAKTVKYPETFIMNVRDTDLRLAEQPSA